MKQGNKQSTTKNQTSSHDLDSLVQDLETVTPKPSWPYGTILGVAILLLALVWGLSFLPLGQEETVSQLDQLRQEQPRPFSWTEEDFISLEMGMTEEEVLSAYGAAHRREDYPNSQSFSLTYEKQDSQTFKTQTVTIHFSTEEEPAIVTSKAAFDLATVAVRPQGFAVSTTAFNDQDIKELRVGDSETGEGGVALTQVLEMYGQPSDVSSLLYDQAPSIYNSKSGLEKRLTLFYRQPDGAPYTDIILSFVALEDGDYFLANKDTE